MTIVRCCISGDKISVHMYTLVFFSSFIGTVKLVLGGEG
jgi:hypothetical protein